MTTYQATLHARIGQWSTSLAKSLQILKGLCKDLKEMTDAKG
jgi:hypothetical protein